jgi:hypothetical protein
MSHRPLYADLSENQLWRSGDYIRALAWLTNRDGSALDMVWQFQRLFRNVEIYVRYLRQLSPRKNSGLTCFNGHNSFIVLLIMVFHFVCGHLKLAQVRILDACIHIRRWKNANYKCLSFPVPRISSFAQSVRTPFVRLTSDFATRLYRNWWPKLARRHCVGLLSEIN